MVFDDPQSRNEAILQNLLGADNVLVEPESRIEAILQSILNETAYLDEPQSRMEELLLAVKNDDAGWDAEALSRNEAIIIAWLNDEEYTAEPQSRIEELLLAWLASIPKYVLKTVVGKVLSITDAIEAPAEALSIELLPTQDLHGYSNPWPAGGGKNLVNLNGFESSTASITVLPQGVTITSTSTGTNRYAIEDLPSSLLGKTVTLHTDVSASSTNSPSARVYFCNDNGIPVGSALLSLNGTGSKTATATIDASFPEGTSRIRLLLYAVTSGTTGEGFSSTFDNLQLEVGSTATSYAPYSNLCPITGTEKAEVVRCGKNLADVVFESVNATNIISNTFPLKAGTYTLSIKYNGTPTYGVYLRNGDNVSSPVLAYIYNTNSLAFTLDSDYSELCVSMYYSGGIVPSEVTDIMLNTGSTASQYEPFDPLSTTLEVEWGDDVGTIYGGRLDAVRGEIVAGMKYAQMTSTYLSGLQAGYIGASTSGGENVVWVRNWNYQKAAARRNGGIDCICNSFKVSMHDTNMSSSQNRVYFWTGSVTTAEGFIQMVQDLEQNGSGLWLCYELATPITIPLSPQTLTMLKNNNTIWSDANGDITLTYRAKAGD